MPLRPSRSSLAAPAAALLAAGLAAPTQASGFKLAEYSARDLGLANAGYAALAADATTIFSNPAGMTKLERAQINGGIHYITGRGEFSGSGSDAFGNPLGGGDGGDAFQDTLVPNLYAAMPMMDGRVWLGLGVSAPFGLATDYTGDWKGRYQAVESNLVTADINPSIGVEVNDWLALGAGISAQYADVKLTNRVDFGSVCLAEIEPVTPPGTCASFGATPQGADGTVELEGDDWSWGWNAGALVDLTPATRVGLSYRSEVSHDIEGSADFTVPMPLDALLAPAFADTGASAPLDLPASASISVRHDWNARLSFMADASWTGWDGNVEALNVSFENPAQPRSVETLDYQDTWRYGVGAEYRGWSDLTVRAGLAYDESPAQEDFRTPRIPDSDRIVLAFGLSWSPEENVTVDAAYQHLFFDDAPTGNVGDAGSRLTGAFDNAADIVGIAINWRR
ncbi:aromatic hydrocarbon degradation protein [Marinicauda algicola]|uniref:Aromatic hydrocarbon degradation protein n=1 Tax=Marinicauda algicola TaxID=2029849 RepID=A0A4S2H4Q4_9PROT|nr:outer membrane protein transport protein [Marinicauda algicola]TGY90604.1 aromatic hydrocarbon degradation protein [Marinicauda algicola]